MPARAASTTRGMVSLSRSPLVQAASLALQERMGFTKVAHFKEVGYKFGRWLDVVFMQLML